MKKSVKIAVKTPVYMGNDPLETYTMVCQDVVHALVFVLDLGYYEQQAEVTSGSKQ